MASTTSAGDKTPIGMAQGTELHNGEKRRGDNSRLNRISAEQKSRILELYEVTGSGYRVAVEMGIAAATVYNHLGLKKYKAPTWTDDENQIVVDGYLAGLPVKQIAEKLPGRNENSVKIAMCRHRKSVKKDPKKRRVMGVMTYVLRAMRKADILRLAEGE